MKKNIFKVAQLIIVVMGLSSIAWAGDRAAVTNEISGAIAAIVQPVPISGVSATTVSTSLGSGGGIEIVAAGGSAIGLPTALSLSGGGTVNFTMGPNGTVTVTITVKGVSHSANFTASEIATIAIQ